MQMHRVCSGRFGARWVVTAVSRALVSLVAMALLFSGVAATARLWLETEEGVAVADDKTHKPQQIYVRRVARRPEPLGARCWQVYSCWALAGSEGSPVCLSYSTADAVRAGCGTPLRC